MRIEGLDVSAFGRLVDWRTGSAPLGDLVVVAGPNEAGKSTLFHFLTTILYGFHPATREGNPHAPWNGDAAGGTAVLRLDDGTRVEVERRLRSQASTRISTATGTEEVRNRPLPWAEHLPRSVYRQVFALTLEELGSLDDETWGRIQDRLIGGMGSSDLVPARRVIADLEREAGELWRPNRRGNQTIRALQERILALRERRRDARARDRQLRDVVERAEETRARLEAVRQERQLERLAVERALALAPIRTQLRRIEALHGDAGPPEILTGYPDEPGRELSRLEAVAEESRERCVELSRARTEPDSTLEAYGHAENVVIRRAEKIGVFLAQAAAIAPERARLASLEREIGDLDRRLEASAGQILWVPWPDAPHGQLAAVSVRDLRVAVRRVRDAEEERRVQEAADRKSLPTAEPLVPRPLSWALLAAGLILLAWGLSGNRIGASAVGSALIALGAGPFLLGGGSFRRRTEPVSDVDAAARTEAEARASLREGLADLPVQDTLLDGAAESIPEVMERIQELMRDSHQREDEAGALRTRLGAIDTEGAALVAAVGLGEVSDAEGAAHRLERALRDAERLKEAASSAERELRRIDHDTQRAEQVLAEARDRAHALRERLRGEGDGDVGEGARRVRQRLQARDRALQLQDELENAHPDLDEIRERIRRAEASGEPWTVDDEDLARRKMRVERLAEEIEELAGKAEALERDAQHARLMETVDAVDGESMALHEKESRLLRERDRRWILSRLLKEADRRFREEHQPDLIRRAGDYLAELTDGRYDRVLADEAADSNRLHLRGPAAPAGIPLAPPLSTGTLEQAYLALRLAIVDHLDQGSERLPLFVDEVLANWDDTRRRAGLALLTRISRERQLFIFTCREDLAAELAGLGAQLLRLPPVE